MHRVVTAVGYGYSGSGAIVDFLKEFSSCYVEECTEIRIFQDPDGISDLEYNLVDNPNGLNSGFAIKRFKALMDWQCADWPKIKWGYDRLIGQEFRELVKDYLERLLEGRWQGAWHRDHYPPYHGPFLTALTARLDHLFRAVGRYHWASCEQYLPIKSPEVFYAATKEFSERLCSLVARGNPARDIVFDQLVPPTNIPRYSRYFHDLKVVVVDRDPRDIYILNNEEWHAIFIPTSDPEAFVQWFLDRRYFTGQLREQANVCEVELEEMIYRYAEFSARLMNFLGYSPEEHCNPRHYFDPAVSEKNTKAWQRYSGYENAVEYIQKHLAPFCERSSRFSS